ncbi:hypothetical protein ALC53_07563 [Atta colombica]|uniref:Uncharacterized protein n=1 Tax=Atta colombica TaxID=520822 RepID=A0A151I2X1_9HYME|nr:hypothetical protein ALC53_07563 [Atta colombica]
MAGHNYLSDPKNPFFSLEDDVDDETFLRNAPVRSESAGRYQNFDNDFTQTRQQLLQRKKEIEERTVQSSERSVSLLRDSEQIGVATAEYKILGVQIIDKFISAKIPNENKNLHNIVMKHMIHGPCGFPKSFQSKTIMDENDYPQYCHLDDMLLITYVRPIEACWRILSKSLQEKCHAVFYLPYDEKTIQYLYSDITSHHVFKKQLMIKLLINFQELRIVNNEVYQTFITKQIEIKIDQKKCVLLYFSKNILTCPRSETCFYIDNTLYYLLKKIINTMAFIAATLLPNGRTVHKVFGLPVPLFADSTSHIDIMQNDLYFGGKIVLLGGNFKQLLPIKQRGSLNEYSDNVHFPEKCVTNANSYIIKSMNGDVIIHKKYNIIANHVILSAQNADIDKINKKVINLLDKMTERIYTNIDTFEMTDNEDEVIMIEYLNALNLTCLPPCIFNHSQLYVALSKVHSSD